MQHWLIRLAKKNERSCNEIAPHWRISRWPNWSMYLKYFPRPQQFEMHILKTTPRNIQNITAKQTAMRSPMVDAYLLVVQPSCTICSHACRKSVIIHVIYVPPSEENIVYYNIFTVAQFSFSACILLSVRGGVINYDCLNIFFRKTRHCHYFSLSTIKSS